MIILPVLAGLLSTLQLCEAHLVLTRQLSHSPVRQRREVGPVLRREKKYRRLQHSIMVQADIRSRSVSSIYYIQLSSILLSRHFPFFTLLKHLVGWISVISNYKIETD